MELSDQAAERPADFDLQRAWEEIAATIDELRSPERVEAMATAEAAEVLRWMFDHQVAVGPSGRDGRLPVSISGQRSELIANQLAGFGQEVEVIAPVEARRCLARIGEELSLLYPAPATEPGDGDAAAGGAVTG